MNFKPYSKCIIILMLISVNLLYSCEYGIFNKDMPDGSRFTLIVDNQIDDDASKMNFYSFEYSANNANKKYLKLTCIHTKNNENVNVGSYTFSSPTLHLSTIDNNTVGLSISNIDIIGFHEIYAKSSISKNFDKCFIINSSSTIEDFDISYSILSDNLDEFEKTLLNSGSIKSSDNSQKIELISDASYMFTLFSNTLKAFPQTEITMSNKEEFKITKIDNSHFKIDTMLNDKSSETDVQIQIKNTNIKANFEITTTKRNTIIIDKIVPKTDEDIIAIKKDDGRQTYIINTKSTNKNNNDELFAYFSMQNSDENISNDILNSQKLKITDISCFFMDLLINTSNKTIEINPLRDTADGDNLNKYCYIYFFDEFKNYISRFRIVIGSVCEKIDITPSSVQTQSQKSGSVQINIFPQYDGEIVWYFSSLLSKFTPTPLSRNEVNQFLFSPNIQKDNQTYYINNMSYNSNEYFFATANSDDNLFYYTTYSNAKSVYLVAFLPKLNMYKAIPFQISGDSQVILKSNIKVVNASAPLGVYNDDKEKFEDEFEEINLPNGQEYPQTYQNGKYGDLTRCFYFPHNSISDITIEVQNLKNNININQTRESSELFTTELFPLGDNDKYTLKITPKWYDNYYMHLLTDNIDMPSTYKDKDKKDMWGKIFYQYIGSAYIMLNANNTNIKLKITIYPKLDS